MKRCTLIIAFAAVTFAVPVVRAADPTPDPASVVLAQNRFAKLTQADYDAEVAQLAPELQYDFATSPRRVAALLDGLLMRKTMAAQARLLHLAEQPGAVKPDAPTEDGALAQMYAQYLDQEAGASFDARSDHLRLRARELYLVDPKRYARPEQVSVSHILFSNAARGVEGALKAAQEAKARLDAGADFAQLAVELSDDGKSKRAGGQLGFLERSQLDPAFARAAFALTRPGEVTGPVHSAYGYHLIRFEDRHPARQITLDEALPGILAEMRAKYVADERNARLTELRKDPSTKVDEAAIERLVHRPPPVRPAK